MASCGGEGQSPGLPSRRLAVSNRHRQAIGHRRRPRLHGDDDDGQYHRQHSVDFHRIDVLVV